jgi:hypothetical protein
MGQPEPLLLTFASQRITEPRRAHSSDVNQALMGQTLEALVGQAHRDPGVRRNLALRQAPMVGDRSENGQIPGRICQGAPAGSIRLAGVRSPHPVHEVMAPMVSRGFLRLFDARTLPDGKTVSRKKRENLALFGNPVSALFASSARE